MSAINEEKRETTSIKIKPQVWKDAKIAAINEGLTVSELVEQAIEEWIQKRASSDKEAEQIAQKYSKKER